MKVAVLAHHVAQIRPPLAGGVEPMRVAAALPRDGVRAFARTRLGIDAMGRRYEALYARLIHTRRAVAA
jgi:hypothetical protein